MGFGLNIASSLMSYGAQKDAANQQRKANEATARSIMLSLSSNLQNMDRQKYDSFTSTVSNLQNAKAQGRRNLSSVQAAINENIGGGGRTGKQIARSVVFDTNKATSSILEGHERVVTETMVNKESAVKSANEQLKSLPKVHEPSVGSMLVGLASSYFVQKQQGDLIGQMRKSAGIGNQTNVPTGRSGASGGFDVSNILYDADLLDLQGQFKFNFKNPYGDKTYF